MIYDIKTAWFLARGQGKKVMILVACVALGVAARVGIGSFLGRLDLALYREARNLMAADIEITSHSPISPEKKEAIRGILPKGSRMQDLAGFVTMAASAASGKSRLVEIRAVEPGYPYYGRLEIESGTGAVGEGARKGDLPVIFAQKELLAQLGEGPGGTVRLGRKDFRLGGILAENPDIGAGFFSLGPRVIADLRDVEGTGLLGARSRVDHSVLIALPDPSAVEDTVRRVRALWSIPDERVSVRDPRTKQGQMSRSFDRLGDYLRLASLVALLLGGVGVGSVARGFAAEQMTSVAVLMTLGCPAGRASRIFFMQLAVAGLSGGILGAALGTAVQNFFPLFLSGFIPVAVEPGPDWPSIAWGVGMGGAVAACFGILPLIEARRSKPLDVFRGEAPPPVRLPVVWALGAGGAALFTLAAALEARSPAKGAFYSGGFIAGWIILHLAGRAVLPGLAARRRRVPWFAIRHGLSNLARPGLRAQAAVVALGLTAFLVGAIAVHQSSLSADLDRSGDGDETPSLFLIDVQDDQFRDLRVFLKEEGAVRSAFSPMVKARYRTLNGRPVRDLGSSTREARQARRMRRREQNLSAREEPGPNERIIAGKWMDGGSGGEVEASLEERFAGRLGAGPGDVLGFDVQGVPLEARVTSIRRVRWSSFLPTFFILVSPRALEGAPRTWVGAVLGLEAGTKSRLLFSIPEKFPNVTIFDVAEISEKITRVMDRMSWSVGFVALFSLGAGLAVLAGTAFAGARQRRADAAVLRTLGGSRGTVLASIAAEFGTISAAASSLGLILSVGFGWAILSRSLNIALLVPWREFAWIFLSLTALASLAGVLACLDAVRVRPLEALRGL